MNSIHKIVIVSVFSALIAFMLIGVARFVLTNKSCVSSAADIKREDVIKWMNDNHIE